MSVSTFINSGIVNFNVYRSAKAGSTYVEPVTGSYDLLETQILGSNTTSITFSNLNSTYGTDYQHLQLRILGRTDRNDTDDFIVLRFNSDSGNNYASHLLRGNGTNVQSSTPRTSYQNIEISGLTAATQTANSFGALIIDILDPFETTKNTTIRTFSGQTGSYNFVGLSSGLWMNTNAVTTILLDQFFGSNFLTGSRFSLYGLKGA